VIVFGSDEFPAFWSRESGLPAPLRYDSPKEIAQFIRTQRDLRLRGGALIAHPIERADEIPRTEMDGYITTATNEAEAAGVRGKAVTPWLLERIGRLTSGRSLTANIALVKNNARLGAEIARSIA
jgi:pseudouridine-5'-phosphate glycosidase